MQIIKEEKSFLMKRNRLHIISFIVVIAFILTAGTSYSQTNKRKKDKKTTTATEVVKNLFKPESNGLQRPKIAFDKTFYDYGEIKRGSDGEVFFTVTNEGNGALVLSNVSASCGCTVVDYSKDAIQPKAKSKIKVKYNTNIVGEIKRSVTVICNDVDKPRTVLLLTGNVVKDEQD